MKKKYILIILFIFIIAAILFSYNTFIKTYTVTYLNEDGTVYKKVEVVNNKTTNLVSPENRDGYYFEGWYFENEKFDFSEKITNDVKLTPIYLSYLENVEYETITNFIVFSIMCFKILYSVSKKYLTICLQQ